MLNTDDSPTMTKLVPGMLYVLRSLRADAVLLCDLPWPNSATDGGLNTVPVGSVLLLTETKLDRHRSGAWIRSCHVLLQPDGRVGWMDTWADGFEASFYLELLPTEPVTK